MTLKSKPLGLIILVILFGGIMFTTAMNWWFTESTKQPAKYTTGEFAGQANPADIRGSYTFGDINKNFGVPLDDLKAAFRVPTDKDVASYQVKNLESQYAAEAAVGKEIGTGSLRMFTAYYKGLPFTLTGDTYLPIEAVNILKTKAKLTPEQISYLDSHAVAPWTTQPAAQNTTQTTAQPVPQTTSQVATIKAEGTATDRTIKGNTNFQQVLDWSVSKQTIETVIGGTMPNPLTTLKDYANQKGVEFSVIKDGLQKEIDKAAPK